MPNQPFFGDMQTVILSQESTLVTQTPEFDDVKQRILHLKFGMYHLPRNINMFYAQNIPNFNY